jgi:hypothetical protein
MSETTNQGTKPAEQNQTTQPSNTEVKLQSEVYELRKQLLDPEYLNYLESKNSAPKAKSEVSTLLTTDLKPEDIDKLPNSQLLKLAESILGNKLVDSLRKEFSGELTGLHSTVQNLKAVLELNEVKSKYSDFEEFRGGIVSLLQSSNRDMSIEDAYKQVKFDKLANAFEGKETENKDKKPGAKGSEKPNQATPPPDLASKEYKTDKEAGAAAAKEIAEKYGLTSGTL